MLYNEVEYDISYMESIKQTKSLLRFHFNEFGIFIDDSNMSLVDFILIKVLFQVPHSNIT